VSIAGHKTNTLKNVNFKKENRDHKKLLKQGENTGNEFHYIKDSYSYVLQDEGTDSEFY